MPDEERGAAGDTWAFTKAAGQGVGEGVVSMAEGLWSLGKGVVHAATDPQARAQAWDTTKKLADAAKQYGGAAIDDPAGAYNAARDKALSLKDAVVAAHDKAAADGTLAEFYGKGIGRGAFEVGMFAVGAGEAGAVAKAGEVAGMAGKAGEVAEVASDAAKAAQAANRLGETANASTKAAEALDNPVLRAADAPATSVQDCPLFHSVTSPKTGQSVLNGVDPAFLNPESRFGKAFYLSDDAETTVAELQSHGAEATHTIRFDLNPDNAKILDLTDPAIAKQWGYGGGSITDATKAIGENAASDFNVIKFPSERGAGGNFAVLKDFDSVLTPQMIFPSTK